MTTLNFMRAGPQSAAPPMEQPQPDVVMEEDEIIRRADKILAERFYRQTELTSAASTKEFLRGKLRNELNEVFAVLFLDNRHRVIEYREMFRGTIDGCSVHPRPIAQAALLINAAAVIFAHNHPSGVASHSMADEHITTRLKSALELIDVRVLDHVIVGGGGLDMMSFAERGLI